MTAEVEAWTPAFEGQRPPFQPGNTLGFKPGNMLAVRHGAKSPRLQGERATAVYAELVEDGEPAWLQDVDRSQLEAWCWAEGTCRMLREWLDRHEPLQPNGKPWPASDELLKWERRAQSHRDALGFNPLARARLGRDTAIAQSSVAANLAALEARGAAARARHEGSS